jgi:hypothetical protein
MESYTYTNIRFDKLGVQRPILNFPKACFTAYNMIIAYKSGFEMGKREEGGLIYVILAVACDTGFKPVYLEGVVGVGRSRSGGGMDYYHHFQDNGNGTVAGAGNQFYYPAGLLIDSCRLSAYI